jgi:hypothetical protein
MLTEFETDDDYDTRFAIESDFSFFFTEHRSAIYSLEEQIKTIENLECIELSPYYSKLIEKYEKCLKILKEIDTGIEDEALQVCKEGDDELEEFINKQNNKGL